MRKGHRRSAVLLVLTVAACAQDGTDGEHRTGSESAGAEETGDAATPRVQEDLLVSVDWLARSLEDGSVLVLHVADDGEAYARAHIPGARFLRLAAISVERDGLANQVPPVDQLDTVFERLGVSRDSRVVLYGAPLHAARAFVTLDVLGLGERAALLDGGLAAWEAAGHPLQTEAPRFEGSTLEPRPRPELVVDADWVARNRERAGVALLDARPPAQYTGEEAGGGVPRGGHIPGAENLFWERAIESTDRPVLLEPERLRELFGEVGVQPGDTVVTYCRSGMQSSFLYFVARYLGYETRLYDGSFLDWSRREELPVEAGQAARSAPAPGAGT